MVNMQFIGWMYDVAREQSPSEDLLRNTLEQSAAVGYNAVGLYFEHRFAYQSAPFATAPGCLTPALIRRLSSTFRPRGLRLIPCLNTLGPMEGFIRSEGGQWLSEGESGPGSAQICPSRPECVRFAQDLVADTMAAFDDEWVHLGGDETRQLGQCPRCAERINTIGTGGLYAEYFARLCQWVLERGRRPCLWGDMLIKHPEALDAIPRQTLIFDWHYETGPRETTRKFRQHGFDVICCPAVYTFDAGWCFLNASRRNIDQHATDALDQGAMGLLVTTWECSFFTQYANILPLVYAAGRRLSGGMDWETALIAEGGAAYTRAAEILGNEIPALSAFLRPGTWRQLRDRFVIRQNPFYLWQAWRDEAGGPIGDEILRLCGAAERALPPEHALQFAVELHRVAVEWVRLVERAYRRYADNKMVACIAELEKGEALLERLRPGLEQAIAAGGSTIDLLRLDLLQEKLARVGRRIGELNQAYRPAFQTLIHESYVAGDQAAWRTARR